MLPVIALASWTTPAHALDSEVYGWDWSRTHRFYLESRVQLPTVMWFATPYNHQARVAGFDLRLNTTCGDAEINTRRTVEVSCTLDDVALSAEALPQEAGKLQPILTELDDMLTGAVVQLVVNRDGRITNIDLEGLERRNRRMGAINENLRLVLTRAFAGLDFELPDDPALEQWAEYDSWLMRAPAADGSAGSSQVVHQLADKQGGFATFVSAGRAVIVPGEGFNKFDTRLTGSTTFDLRNGRISDRTWTVVGGPTASSWLANGAAGYPYIQEGRVVALGQGQTWDVGESLEVPPDQRIPTAIQQGGPGELMGLNPNR
ncbi:MAG: hypothetical protein R3F59_36185 [Myxococcota bacterium]